MAAHRLAWLAAGALLSANIVLRLSAPPSEAHPAYFAPPQQVQERAWLLHDDPQCLKNDTHNAAIEAAAARYLDALHARGSHEEALPMAPFVWSVGNDRGLPVVYIPCRGVFRVLPSLWTELKAQGSGALP